MTRDEAEATVRRLLPINGGNPVSYVAVPIGVLEVLLQVPAPSRTTRADAEVAAVLEFGSRKHASSLVEEGAGASLEEHLRSAQGHLQAYWDGVREDPETWRSPLAHAAARLLLATELELQRGGGRAAGE